MGGGSSTAARDSVAMGEVRHVSPAPAAPEVIAAPAKSAPERPFAAAPPPKGQQRALAMPSLVDAPADAGGCYVVLTDVPPAISPTRMRAFLEGLGIAADRVKLRGGGVVEVYFKTEGAAQGMTRTPFFFMNGKRVRVGLLRREGQNGSQLFAAVPQTKRPKPRGELVTMSEPLMRQKLRREVCPPPPPRGCQAMHWKRGGG